MSKRKRPDLLVVLALIMGFELIAIAAWLEWFNTSRSKMANRDQLHRAAQEAILDRHVID